MWQLLLVQGRMYKGYKTSMYTKQNHLYLRLNKIKDARYLWCNLMMLFGYHDKLRVSSVCVDEILCSTADPLWTFCKGDWKSVRVFFSDFCFLTQRKLELFAAQLKAFHVPENAGHPSYTEIYCIFLRLGTQKQSKYNFS